MSIEQILDLEQLEVNIYRGRVFSPESGNWQRTFGGHVAGQSLVSAVRTVDPHYLVHSLHGYFLRPGDAKAPTVFSSNASVTAARFAPGVLTRSSMGRRSFPCRRRFKPTKAASSIKT